MDEWLIRCTDDLKSGAYYVSVDIHDGEQPVMILFKKDGDKTFVIGQGEPVNQHGDLIDRDAVRQVIKPWAPEDERAVCTFDTVKKLMHTLLTNAHTVIPASE